MSFQSSILSMIHTTTAGLKAAEFVDKAAEKPKQPTEPKQPTAPQTMQPKAEEPVFIGGQQVSPEIAAKVRAALEQKQKAEASMVVAQQQKRAKRAKAFSEEPPEDLINFRHLGMEAMI